MRETFLPYCRPAIDESDVEAVARAMRNGWLTTGPVTKGFEQRFATLARAKHAIALNSATAGLHVALLAHDIGPGDEVVLPSLTFVAAAHCVAHCGATPVFCDVEPDTLCASVRTIDAVLTERTRAIITMPYAGRPSGIGAIAAYARARGIAVIEDAALAVGTLDDGSWPGAQTAAAVFSFYATKNITSAEGGMVVTNDDALAERMRILLLHGMDRDAWKRYTAGGTWRYDVTEFGWKYNLSDLAAALGASQLDRLDALQARRDEIAATYLTALERVPGVDPAAVGRIGPRDRHSWAFFPVLIDADMPISRDTVIESMRAANIGTSVHYIPSHLFSIYREPRRTLPATEFAFERLISLPLFPGMSDDDVNDVVEALAAAVGAVPSAA